MGNTFLIMTNLICCRLLNNFRKRLKTKLKYYNYNIRIRYLAYTY